MDLVSVLRGLRDRRFGGQRESVSAAPAALHQEKQGGENRRDQKDREKNAFFLPARAEFPGVHILVHIAGLLPCLFGLFLLLRRRFLERLVHPVAGRAELFRLAQRHHGDRSGNVRALRKGLQRGAELSRRGVAVLRAEGRGAPHHVAEGAPRRRGIGERLALHAALQRGGPLLRRVVLRGFEKGLDAAVQRRVEHQRDGINVRGRAPVPAPELFRGDELQLVGIHVGDALPVCGADGHLSVRPGNVAGPDAAVAAVRAHGALHRGAEIGAEAQRLLRRHGEQPAGERVVRVKSQKSHVFPPAFLLMLSL